MMRRERILRSDFSSDHPARIFTLIFVGFGILGGISLVMFGFLAYIQGNYPISMMMVVAGSSMSFLLSIFLRVNTYQSQVMLDEVGISFTECPYFRSKKKIHIPYNDIISFSSGFDGIKIQTSSGTNHFRVIERSIPNNKELLRIIDILGEKGVKETETIGLGPHPTLSSTP